MAKKGLRLTTIIRAIQRWHSLETRLAAAENCSLTVLPQWLIERWKYSDDQIKRLAVMYSMGPFVTMDDIHWGLSEARDEVFCGTLKICVKHHIALSISLFDTAVQRAYHSAYTNIARNAIIELALLQDYPWKRMKRWYGSSVISYRAGVALLAAKKTIPEETIMEALRCYAPNVSESAVMVARWRQLSAKKLEDAFLENPAMCSSHLVVLQGRQEAKDFLLKVVLGQTPSSITPEMEILAAKAFKGISLSVEERWTLRQYGTVAAITALLYAEATSQGDEFTYFLAESTDSNNAEIRDAAYYAAYRKKTPKMQQFSAFFPVRTISGVLFGYKKCLEDVLVVAEIPLDATVYGSYDGKCRADKAVIRAINGTFCGERVGVSSYDHTFTYHVGDEIAIKEFNTSDDECAAGFHFFCTKQTAIDYR